MKYLIWGICIFFVFFLLGSPSPKDVVGASDATKESEAIQILNEYRAAKGKSKVAPSPQTCQFADARLPEVMAKFSHDGFINHATKGFWTENLAVGYKNASEVLAAWENSPPHDRNLLESTPDVCIVEYQNYWIMIGYAATPFN